MRRSKRENTVVYDGFVVLVSIFSLFMQYMDVSSVVMTTTFYSQREYYYEYQNFGARDISPAVSSFVTILLINPSLPDLCNAVQVGDTFTLNSNSNLLVQPVRGANTLQIQYN